MAGVFLALIGGCTPATVTYRGGRRTPGEVATIHAKDTVLEEIDQVRVRGSAFEVLPGPHALLVRLEVSGDPFTGRYYSQRGLAICFTARPGRAYTVVPAFIDGGRWKPEIVDRATTTRIPVRYAMPATSECLGQRPSGPDVPVEQPGTLAATTPAINEGASGERTPDPFERGDAPPSPQAHDREEPPPPRPRSPPASPATSVRRWEVRPGSGVGLEAGLFVGGADLVEVVRSNGNKEKLTAGGGYLLALAVMVTPLWVEDSVGFGAGFNAGWKGDSIDAPNGSVTFWRLPLSATVHALLPVGRGWFFLPRFGLFGDFGARLSGNGFGGNVATDLSTGLGTQFEAAMYWCSERHESLSVGLRYSLVDYSAGGGSVDGNSLGLAISAYYNF